MGLIQQIEQALLDRLKAFLAPLITPIQKLWGILKGFFTALIELVPATIKLVNDTITEIRAWKEFKKGINFKTGVISLKSVKDHVEELVQEIITAWQSLVDLFTSGFKLPARGISEAADALQELVVGFEDVFGKFGLEAGLKRLGGLLEKAGGKVFEVLALIQSVAEEALKVVTELQSIVDAVRDVREAFQTGSFLFLKQTNPRRVVQLADGTSIKIRVGNLHS